MSTFTFQDISPVPIWDPAAQITLTGKEFEYFHNFFQMIQNLPYVTNDIKLRHEQAGIIQYKFFYPNGSEAPAEEVQKFKEWLESERSKIMASKAIPENQPENNAENKPEATA